MTKIAINGFGRIGRNFLRQILNYPEIEVVAINDLGSVENLAYLFKYDSVYGKYRKEVSLKGEGSSKRYLVIGEREILFLQEKDPTKLPWRTLDVDIVIESTGLFTSFEKSKVHLDAGAKRVVISAPAKDEDGDLGKTVLAGINEETLRTCAISSTGSCTTNGVSPVMAILSENPGIKKAILNTAHAYTATQKVVDGLGEKKDMRSGRAAAINIIPGSTGAAISVIRALPELKDKFDGIALRVPVPAGSIADITFISARSTSVEEINKILTDASTSERWQGIMGVTNEPLVSSDIVGEKLPALVDLSYTRVVDGDLVKVLVWYDNEAGYITALVRQVLAVAKLM
jgi:glyceraldehyde 3-phosphate dehydrogenase